VLYVAWLIVRAIAGLLSIRSVVCRSWISTALLQLGSNVRMFLLCTEMQGCRH
jgi:hypothetical protein